MHHSCHRFSSWPNQERIFETALCRMFPLKVTITLQNVLINTTVSCIKISQVHNYLLAFGKCYNDNFVKTHNFLFTKTYCLKGTMGVKGACPLVASLRQKEIDIMSSIGFIFLVNNESKYIIHIVIRNKKDFDDI